MAVGHGIGIPTGGRYAISYVDFLTQPECTTVVTGVGYVVREIGDSYSAAIHFDLGFAPKSESLQRYFASRARRAALNDCTPSAT